VPIPQTAADILQDAGADLSRVVMGHLDTSLHRPWRGWLRPVLIDHLLLSHDICYKIQLQAYGGYGYAHLLRNIVPRLQLLGIGAEQLRRILVENPRRIFAMSGEQAAAEA
jgi:predicted metal-dependent phosphotriesterase family hydrolase